MAYNGLGFLLPPLAGQVVLIFPAYRQAGVLHPARQLKINIKADAE